MPPLWLFIACTAGTVLHLFLFIALIAYRQKRSYEAVLSLLFFSLFLGYSSLLLRFNSAQYYGSIFHIPNALHVFNELVLAAATVTLPAFLVHTHVSYYTTHGRRIPSILILLMYFPAPYFAWQDFRSYFVREIYGPQPHHMWLWADRRYLAWAAVGLMITFVFQSIAVRKSQSPIERRFHILVLAVILAALVCLPRLFLVPEPFFVMLLIPSSVLAYQVLRGPFLRITLPQNLRFTVVGGFGAVLYLTLASRISQWLESWFPPVATISILVFVLVFLYEPLQRALSRGLQRLMREEVEKVQRVLTAVHNEARGGELVRLLDSAEARIREEFTLEAARIVLRDGPARPAVASGNVQRFPMMRGAERAGQAPPLRRREKHSEEIGVLEAYFHGGMLSGETHAALETLAAQLPAAIDLCRAIEEKLTLERELAERERLALLGQMAASISHNLKNPLGSMKTLLQVQLENPELPEAMRRDCQLVVAEVDRLSAKLNQLLRYAKPGLRESGAHAMRTEVSAATAQVIELLRREAQQRGIALWLDRPPGEITVRGSEEALSDVLQNLIVNAIEATPPRGAVRVTLSRDAARAQIIVSDEGPGIPADVQAKIFQPFFTTKPQGTGLGLAIVQRRLAEIGGTIECRSPAASGRGTEFVFSLPLAAEGLATDEH